MREQVASFLINLQNLLNKQILKLIRYPHFVVIFMSTLGIKSRKQSATYIVIVGLTGGGDFKYLHACNNDA